MEDNLAKSESQIPGSLEANSLALRAKAPRLSETQLTIAEIVRSLPRGQHLTAPEVFEKAKTLGLDVSLSTVYRTLSRLKAVGNVMTVAGERGLRYETTEDGPEHDHLICLGCGLTIEFVDDLIRGFGKTVAQRKGYEHKSSRFDILGYCSDCNTKDEAHQQDQALQFLNGAQTRLEEIARLLKETIEHLNARKQLKALRASEESVQELKATLADCQSALTLIARHGADGIVS